MEVSKVSILLVPSKFKNSLINHLIDDRDIDDWWMDNYAVDKIDESIYKIRSKFKEQDARRYLKDLDKLESDLNKLITEIYESVYLNTTYFDYYVDGKVESIDKMLNKLVVLIEEIEDLDNEFSEEFY